MVEWQDFFMFGLVLSAFFVFFSAWAIDMSEAYGVSTELKQKSELYDQLLGTSANDTSSRLEAGISSGLTEGGETDSALKGALKVVRGITSLPANYVKIFNQAAKDLHLPGTLVSLFYGILIITIVAVLAAWLWVRRG